MIPETINALILDMDGVLWRDTAPIGDLPAIFEHLQKRKIRVALASNNSTKTVNEFLEKLSGFGVKLGDWQILTASIATAVVLGKHFPDGGSIFVIGENGIRRSLEEAGFIVITDPEDDTEPIAVVLGLDWQINYPKLRRATLHIRNGVPFYGTNPDKTYPTPEGLVPGAGSLQAALESATGVSPIVIGKPSALMMEMALERLGTAPNQTMVIGDRLETDISAGQAAGCKTALVLSGVATRAQLKNWEPSPDMIADDLSTLLGI